MNKITSGGFVYRVINLAGVTVVGVTIVFMLLKIE